MSVDFVVRMKLSAELRSVRCLRLSQLSHRKPQSARTAILLVGARSSFVVGAQYSVGARSNLLLAFSYFSTRAAIFLIDSRSPFCRALSYFLLVGTRAARFLFARHNFSTRSA